MKPGEKVPTETRKEICRAYFAGEGMVQDIAKANDVSIETARRFIRAAAPWLPRRLPRSKRTLRRMLNNGRAVPAIILAETIEGKRNTLSPLEAEAILAEMQGQADAIDRLMHRLKREPTPSSQLDALVAQVVSEEMRANALQIECDRLKEAAKESR